MRLDAITIVVAVNNRSILEANLLRSPLLAAGSRHQLLIREGFKSAALAYNDALEIASNEIVVFIHQDVYLPDHWLADLEHTIEHLDRSARPWGVIGCFGARKNAQGGLGTVYSTGWGLQGKTITDPEKVETVDEIVLVVRKSAGLRFDSSLPGYHLYGVDLCLAAKSMGMETYVMPTFCVHNTRQLMALPDEYFACYRYMRRKWQGHLPIHTSCIKITRLNAHYFRKRLEARVIALTGRKSTGAERLADPRTVVPGMKIDGRTGVQS